MRRSGMSRGGSRRQFRSGVGSRAINLRSAPMRGGWRL